MSKRTLDNSLQGESRELMMGRRGMTEITEKLVYNLKQTALDIIFHRKLQKQRTEEKEGSQTMEVVV
ncbi:hypothetical protein J6590_105021 [Homalodisca vitripennis]|nr:hypothetical protein J6590_105021 [Homalodisca vitripennis]